MSRTFKVIRAVTSKHYEFLKVSAGSKEEAIKVAKKVDGTGWELECEPEYESSKIIVVEVDGKEVSVE
jgi:hypothetical protein